MIEKRLIDLEIKFSHQEVLLEELQKLSHEQSLALGKMEKILKAITDKMNQDEELSPTVHQKPPHY